MAIEIFLKIWDMSLTASFVILFVMVVRLLLKKAPRIISYVLWAVVLFRLLCPFAPENEWSLIPERTAAETGDRGVPAIADNENKENPQVIATNTEADIWNRFLSGNAGESTGGTGQKWIFAGTAVWVTGMLLFALYHVVSVWRLRRKLVGAVWLKEHIFVADHIGMPFVMGVLRPRIYLPSALPEQDHAYIILHEQTHIRHFDPLLKLIAFIALLLHWFNPLVWAAFILIGRDMETACDESVVRRLGNASRSEYSALLLELATGAGITGRMPLACRTPLAFGESDPKGRIKHILRYRKPAIGISIMAAVLALAAGIGLFLNPNTPIQEEPQADVPQTEGNAPDDASQWAGVKAVILETYPENKQLMVQGTDENSPIGDRCFVSCGAAELFQMLEEEPVSIEFARLNRGDTIVIACDIVQETYPTQTTARSIQLIEEAAATGANQQVPPAQEQDKLGVYLSAADVTATGMTLQCRQADGQPTGDLTTGTFYWLEKWEEDQWMPVAVKEPPSGSSWGWEDVGWIINKNGDTEWEVDWKLLYGSLPAGSYRIGKEINDFRQTADFDKYLYYAEFTVSDEGHTGPAPVS